VARALNITLALYQRMDEMNRRSCRGDDQNEVHCLTARCAGASVRQPAGVTTQTRRAAGMLRQAHVSGDVADGFLSISSRHALFQGQARVSGDVADGADGRGGAGVSRYAAAQGCRPNKQVVPVYL